jgi:hypothetical protein
MPADGDEFRRRPYDDGRLEPSARIVGQLIGRQALVHFQTRLREKIMGEVVKGLLLGALLGTGGGFGLSWWWSPLLFPGDFVVAGAVVGGVCGFIWGDDFFDWIRDYWHLLP